MIISNLFFIVIVSYIWVVIQDSDVICKRNFYGNLDSVSYGKLELGYSNSFYKP